MMCPILEELQQPYLKNFFACKGDRVDDGPPVFQIVGKSLSATSTHEEALPQHDNAA